MFLSSDKLYVVGGSDGQQSLSSIEIYDITTNTWSLGPSLSTPRANVAVALVQDKLFSVGGFSGKVCDVSFAVIDLVLLEHL